jgi:hypothetical protein
MNEVDRRQFLKGDLALGAGLALTPLSRVGAAATVKTTQVESKGFFTLSKRKDHWWLITPEGKPFFTISGGGIFS